MKLYLFRTGTVVKTGAPVPAYLVRHDDGDVLIDTGYPRTRGTGPDEPVAVAPGEDVVTRLERLGVEPGDLTDVVLSHFDPDHAGNLDAFPRARFWVQADHLAAARSGAVPRLERFRTMWDLPDERFRPVSGDHELLPGIELIESGGHVPGHQSVLLRPPGAAPVLLAVDAIPTAADLDAANRRVYPLDVDEDAVRASTRRLADLAERENARIVHGHDAAQWADLPLSPDPYPL